MGGGGQGGRPPPPHPKSGGGGGQNAFLHPPPPPPPPKKKGEELRGKEKNTIYKLNLLILTLKNKFIYASIFRFREQIISVGMSPTSVARGGGPGGTGGIAPTNMLFTNKLKTGKGEKFRLVRFARSQSFK